jgi:hypothetical protein
VKAVSELLKNRELLADAGNAASLFTSDLIAADKSFDVYALAAARSTSSKCVDLGIAPDC